MPTSFEYKTCYFKPTGDGASLHTVADLTATLNLYSQSGWRYKDCLMFTTPPILVFEREREDTRITGA